MTINVQLAEIVELVGEVWAKFVVYFLQDDVQFFKGRSDLANNRVVCSQVESLVDFDEGGCSLHVDEGILVLLTLNKR